MQRSIVLVAALAIIGAAPLEAQSTMWGSVSGRVTDVFGQSLSGAVVTLAPVGSGIGREAVTSFAGEFDFSLVGPGTYELRAEILGYRPLVARPVSLNGGERRQFDLTLQQAAPPIAEVDTLALGTVFSGRIRPAGVRMGAAELHQLPDRFDDLSSTVSLSDFADGSEGIEGLPGSETLVVADGIPVYRAPHPIAKAEPLAIPAFSRSLLSGISVYHGVGDVEWGSSASGQLALSTLSGTEQGRFEADGSWSGGPLWSSSELNVDKPSLLTFTGGLRNTVELSPGQSQIVLGGEVLQVETPLEPRVDEALATSLAGLDPDLISTLSTPSTERVSRYGALARADLQGGSGSHVFIRGSAAYLERAFDGPGPITLAGAPSLPEKSVDVSIAGGVISPFSETVHFEVRSGLSVSNRKFEAPVESSAAAFLGSDGAALGFDAAGAAESKRTDLLVVPMLHYERWGGVGKVGISARLTTQTMSSDPRDEFFFSDAAALLAGQGFARTSTSREASFTTGEIGFFAAYDIALSPDLQATFGARLDLEKLPDADVAQNTAWLLATGLRNDTIPSTLRQFGFRSALTFEPVGSGSRVTAAVSMRSGDVDPRILFEALSRDNGATSAQYAGGGLTWPGPLPSSATVRPTLSLLGPDTRAPRTVDASVQFTQRIVGDWSMYGSGAVRRTDFLMRRRNLNLPSSALAVDAFGRDVFGTLAQDGAIVTATADDGRRFPAFNEVWALDPDGWSEYRAASAGLGYDGDAVALLGSYTWSETTDNWIGASSGSPYGELSPLLPTGDVWSEGTSDFDVRHRVNVRGSATVGPTRVSLTYRFRTGRPFTPGYRLGVDANGDGSTRNDVAFVDSALLGSLLDEWPCLADQADAFAERNSCRGPSRHAVDARVSFTLGRVQGRPVSVVIEGFNLIESKDGIIDDALLLVDPAGSITTSGGTVTVPVTANPSFGDILYPSSPGRTLRVGVSVR